LGGHLQLLRIDSDFAAAFFAFHHCLFLGNLFVGNVVAGIATGATDFHFASFHLPIPAFAIVYRALPVGHQQRLNQPYQAFEHLVNVLASRRMYGFVGPSRDV
jgi:hypothetical protein